jgi:hypothetical protein
LNHRSMEILGSTAPSTPSPNPSIAGQQDELESCTENVSLEFRNSCNAWAVDQLCPSLARATQLSFREGFQTQKWDARRPSGQYCFLVW